MSSSYKVTFPNGSVRELRPSKWAVGGRYPLPVFDVPGYDVVMEAGGKLRAVPKPKD